MRRRFADGMRGSRGMVPWAVLLVKRYYYVVLLSNDGSSMFEWKLESRPVLERVMHYPRIQIQKNLSAARRRYVL